MHPACSCSVVQINLSCSQKFHLHLHVPELVTAVHCQDYEKLAIFGDIRGRRGAELKVLSAIETKSPGDGPTASLPRAVEKSGWSMALSNL